MKKYVAICYDLGHVEIEFSTKEEAERFIKENEGCDGWDEDSGQPIPFLNYGLIERDV